jgi:uncharacterized protein (TIGR03086 family)
MLVVCQSTPADLVDHVGGLSLAFAEPASKATGPGGSQAPSADAPRLGDDWRIQIPQAVAALAEAWRDPAAWTGTTEAGGRKLPGEVAGLIALDELVIHGWDLARATEQPYDCDEPTLEAVHGFVLAVLRSGL